MSDNEQAQRDADFVPTFVGLAVEMITRTVFNRARSKYQLVVDKPRVFVAIDEDGVYQAYFDTGEACYKSVNGIFPYSPEHFKLRFDKPRITTTLNMGVKQAA